MNELSSLKLDNRMFENIQNIWESHKLHHEGYGNWKVESAEGGKTLGTSQNAK